MSTTVVHRDNCRLCYSKDVELVVKLSPIPLAEKYKTTAAEAKAAERFPIDLYQCRTCGHVQLLDVIDSENLWDDYTYHSGQTQGIVDHFEEVAQKLLEKYNPAPGSLIIDVGSNDGSLLRPFKRRGFKVLGIDPAKEIARKATESGIETIPALMTTELAEQITKTHGTAAIITAFNVFAHADDMNGMAASIATMLSPSGVFVFEVQYLADIIDKFLLGTIFHEHMSHHSLDPMNRFLSKHGLSLLDVERVNIQKGSIIGVAQHTGGKRPVSAAVTDLLKLEKDRNLNSPETVKQFARTLASLQKETTALITQWTKAGATIAGFGAARSGPTLTAQFGLGEVIQYIFDDHPQKVGKFSPGDGIPVIPTNELLTRKPDYVVILAWIHAKKIIASNRAYLEQGGKFLVCCPTVQVIDKNSTPQLL